MMKTVVQIREEEKAFSRPQLAEVLNISNTTLKTWIAKGKISSPTGYGGRFTKVDIKGIFKRLAFLPTVRFSGKGRKRWNDVVKSRLVLERGGIFANLHQKARRKNIEILNMIEDYGLWDAQGLNNHEHLREYVKNPILQMILSEQLIEKWIGEAKVLKPVGQVVIYWNGSVNSTVCIYLMHKLKKGFLEEYDKYLRIRKCVVTKIRF